MKTILGHWMRHVVAVTAAVGATLIGGTATAHPDGPPVMQPNIIGGHAPTQNYPAGAKVSLKYDAPDYGRTNWHTCGGYLVFAKTVVTNAHCVTDPPPEASAAQRTRMASMFGVDAVTLGIPTAAKQFWVRVGSDNRDEGGVIANATVTYVDPDWDWATGDGPVDDIAVLTLDHSLDVQTVPIAPSKATPGTKVFELGWGVVNPDGTGPLPTMIQELQTTVARNRACADAFIAVREICLDNPNGTDGVCFGDSGGPALQKINGVFYVVGGTSRGAGQFCGIVPVVYTSTPEHRSAIYDAARGVPASSGTVRRSSIMNADPAMGLPYERPDGCISLDEACRAPR